MADSTPNWETFPCLDDVLTKADIDSKGGGSFKAEYVNWCKTAQLLRQHAKGWQFELRQTLDANGNDTDVFRAPNGTGYLKGFFRAPTGSGFLDTPDFPQAIMNHQNKPIEWGKITARDVTDTHRRCMCTAAAAHFGLAWQLWAKVEIENPMRPDEVDDLPTQQPPVKAKPNPPAKAESVAKPEMPPLEEKVQLLRSLMLEAGLDVVALWKEAFKSAFNIAADAQQITGSHITTEDQFVFTENFINEKLQSKS